MARRRRPWKQRVCSYLPVHLAHCILSLDVREVELEEAEAAPPPAAFTVTLAMAEKHLRREWAAIVVNSEQIAWLVYMLNPTRWV